MYHFDITSVIQNSSQQLIPQQNKLAKVWFDGEKRSQRVKLWLDWVWDHAWLMELIDVYDYLMEFVPTKTAFCTVKIQYAVALVRADTYVHDVWPQFRR